MIGYCQRLNKIVLDGKRTKTRNLAFWKEKPNSQFWTEFGRKKWANGQVITGIKCQIVSHSHCTTLSLPQCFLTVGLKEWMPIIIGM